MVAQLRRCIPNVSADTKLSKIKTLKLATSYISYLTRILDNGQVVKDSSLYEEEQDGNIKADADTKVRPIVVSKPVEHKSVDSTETSPMISPSSQSYSLMLRPAYDVTGITKSNESLVNCSTMMTKSPCDNDLEYIKETLVSRYFTHSFLSSLHYTLVSLIRFMFVLRLSSFVCVTVAHLAMTDVTDFSYVCNDTP